MHFCKYVGAGNDFILIDNRDLLFPSSNIKMISHLCHRQFGIGADGLILLENSHSADYKMRIFNADGHEAEMCGNGIRCLFKFIVDVIEKKEFFLIETKESVIRVSQHKEMESYITAEMQNPFDINWDIKLPIESNTLTLSYLNTGVPHAVIFQEEIKDEDVKVLGKKVRFHTLFNPKGTNVNFVKKLSENEIMIRTYERGVEDETLACGTGATAAALTAAYTLNLTLPIRVKTKSGEILIINGKLDASQIKDVTMTGKASFVFRGIIDQKQYA